MWKYEVAQSLQERYRSGETRSLTLLYLELRRMAEAMLRYLKADPEKLDSYSHEAATQLVERYLRDPSYRITNFYATVKRASLDAKSERSLNPSAGRDRPKARAHTNWVDLTDLQIPVIDEDAEFDDPALLDGLSAYFSHFSWYRPAIKTLSRYVSKTWMLSNATQIKSIFLEARKNAGRRRPQSADERSGTPEPKAGRPTMD